MATSDCFNTGFLVSDQPDEEVFLSVTPGLEGGPGIERDGVTYPRMRDPHTIDGIRSQHGLRPDPQSSRMTQDAWEQRAGTWTIYQHVREFMEGRPDLLVVGVQSNGDLTMNPWHIAYIGASHIPGQQDRMCGLLYDEPREPVQSRTYRCLVKWKNNVAAKAHRHRYDFLNLRIQKKPNGRYTPKLYDLDDFPDRGAWLRAHKCYATRRDIGPLVEFALTGKPIVERSLDLSPASAIDRFQDVRHVFDLPEVGVSGMFRGSAVKSVNLGEYQLFGNLNERRAALSSAVVIDLDVRDVVRIDPETLKKVLLENHFRQVSESPTRPGQFRMYEAEAHRCRVEVYFPHNVYPFGALGMQARTGTTATDQLVCLSAGGLSGRVGNTLEGITRIMYDFFGCSDAMILDEGLDVFSIINPGAKYDNPALLRKILHMVRAAVAADQRQVQERHPGKYEYIYGEDFRKWPLNRAMMDEIDSAGADEDDSNVVLVRPQRSQIRSVLIFAVPRLRTL